MLTRLTLLCLLPLSLCLSTSYGCATRVAPTSSIEGKAEKKDQHSDSDLKEPAPLEKESRAKEELDSEALALLELLGSKGGDAADLIEVVEEEPEEEEPEEEELEEGEVGDSTFKRMGVGDASARSAFDEALRDAKEKERQKRKEAPGHGGLGTRGQGTGGGGTISGTPKGRRDASGKEPTAKRAKRKEKASIRRCKRDRQCRRGERCERRRCVKLRAPLPPPPPPGGGGDSGEAKRDKSKPDDVSKQLVDIGSVDRYPSMQAPDAVGVGEVFPLMVSLTVDRPDKASLAEATGSSKVAVSDEGKMAIDLPKDEERWTLRVVLQAPGFELANGSQWMSTIELPRDGDSTPALFQLRAKPGSDAKDLERTLSVTLWHDTYLARLKRTVRVTPKVRPTPRSGLIPSTADTGRSPAPSSAPLAIEVEERSVPDLTVRIQYDDPMALGDGQLIIASPHLSGQVVVERFTTPPTLPNFLASYYARFLDAARTRGMSPQGGGSRGTARPKALMKGFGKTLYQRYAPGKLKAVISELIARSPMPLQTIQFYSNNPVVPWELMFVSDAKGGDVGYLGTEFQVARWHITDSAKQLDKPTRNVSLDKLVAIAPKYKGAKALPAQTRELASLAKLPVYERLKGDSASFERLMASLPDGMVHFSGHGTVALGPLGVPEFSISLGDGELDLMTWRGMLTPPRGRQPLFFFNACDVGQAKAVAGFVEGWAPAVLETGASGYIGGLWPLTDAPAADFAAAFYGEVSAGIKSGRPVSVAKALTRARRGFFEHENPTYLAYVYYGDVNLHFTPN